MVRQLLIASFVLLLSPALAQAAGDSAFSKPLFELDTHILVWDIGTQPGIADAKDDLTDIEVPCALNGPDPDLKITRKNRYATQEAEAARTLMKQAGLDNQPYSVNAVAAGNAGEGRPLFLLFPELHLSNKSRPGIAQLHMERALDMYAMALQLVKSGQKPLNSDEGPLGLTYQRTSPQGTTLTAFVNRYWASGAVLMAEMFKPEDVRFMYSDDNDLYFRGHLVLQALQGASWDAAAKMLMSTERGARLLNNVKLESYRQYFARIQNDDRRKLESAWGQICERRSEVMASETAKAGGRYVFMSFGSLHTHGIVKYLRENKFSYIVFSPNR